MRKIVLTMIVSVCIMLTSCSDPIVLSNGVVSSVEENRDYLDKEFKYIVKVRNYSEKITHIHSCYFLYTNINYNVGDTIRIGK